MILPIVGYGNPILKKIAQKIEKNYPDLKTLISDMFETQGYTAGDAMQTSMALILIILIIPSIFLFLAAKNLKADEESVVERANKLGEK